MVKMGAREFVYPNFGYRSRWLRNRDPVYCYTLPVSRSQIFYSQYDSRYVGCHWLRFAPFLCTNLIGQGPELLTTPAAIKICGDC